MALLGLHSVLRSICDQFSARNALRACQECYQPVVLPEVLDCSSYGNLKPGSLALQVSRCKQPSCARFQRPRAPVPLNRHAETSIGSLLSLASGKTLGKQPKKSPQTLRTLLCRTARRNTSSETLAGQPC